MLWFIIALVAAALWAIINIIDDNLMRDVYRHPEFGVIISGLFGGLPLIALFFIDLSYPSLAVVLAGLTSGLLLVSSYFFYFSSLQRETPSVVAAIWMLGPALIPFLAYFFLDEVLSVNQYVGFSLILLAAIGLSITKVKGFKLSKAFYLMVVASIMVAVLSVLQKYVYQYVDFWNGFVLVSSGMVLGAISFILITDKGNQFFTEARAMRKFAWLFLVVELLNVTAVLLANFAISIGSVSLVKVVDGAQPLFVIGFSLLLYPFFPKLSRDAVHGSIVKRILLILVMILGLYLINLPGLG